MVSGAEPSMSREMSNSVRTECGKKEKTEESVCKAGRALTPKGFSQDKTKLA